MNNTISNLEYFPIITEYYKMVSVSKLPLVASWLLIAYDCADFLLTLDRFSYQ